MRTWCLFFLCFCGNSRISWPLPVLYRAQYQDAGMRMLTVLDPSGRRAGRQAIAAAVSVLIVSLVPAALAMDASPLFIGVTSRTGDLAVAQIDSIAAITGYHNCTLPAANLACLFAIADDCRDFIKPCDHLVSPSTGFNTDSNQQLIHNDIPEHEHVDSIIFERQRTFFHGARKWWTRRPRNMVTYICNTSRLFPWTTARCACGYFCRLKSCSLPG